ncbi:MAG: hypothetical protein ACTSWN_17000 [Promethearchaeota archaeon]
MKRNEPCLFSQPMMDRIFVEAGLDLPEISASIALCEILERIGLEIVKIARELLDHADKATLSPTDIQMAYDLWKEKHLKALDNEK